VAIGHADREIAAVLFISRRTATTHLIHTFDKLGLDSRIATAWTEPGAASTVARSTYIAAARCDGRNA